MKKLFFSAVALVAFSGVSMAKTIAIEEEKLVDESAKTKVVLNSACHGVSFAAYNALRLSGLTVDESRINANGAYF